MTTNTQVRVALVTGGTAGLGLALTRALAADGWRVITDGRNEGRIKEADFPASVTAIVGDITDADHRSALVNAVWELGRLDLLGDAHERHPPHGLALVTPLTALGAR